MKPPQGIARHQQLGDPLIWPGPSILQKTRLDPQTLRSFPQVCTAFSKSNLDLNLILNTSLVSRKQSISLGFWCLFRRFTIQICSQVCGQMLLLRQLSQDWRQRSDTLVLLLFIMCHSTHMQLYATGHKISHFIAYPYSCFFFFFGSSSDIPFKILLFTFCIFKYLAKNYATIALIFIFAH